MSQSGAFGRLARKDSSMWCSIRCEALVVAVLLVSPVNPAMSEPTVPGGYTIEKFVDISRPIGIAIDPAGNLYAGNDPPGGGPSEPARIRFVSSDGLTVTEIGDLMPDPDTVLVDVYGYVAEAGNVLVGADGLLKQVNPVTGTTSTVLSGSLIVNVAEMAFDSNGRLFVGQLGVRAPVLVVEQGTASVFERFDGDHPTGLTIDDNDNIFVACRTSSSVFRLDALGVDPPQLLATLPGTTNTVAYASEGIFAGDLFVGTQVDGTIHRVDPDTGEASLFAAGFLQIACIAFGPDGSMFVSEPGGDAIYRITPSTLSLNLDIKAGSCPNPLNLKSRGKLPVALLGTEEFDVSTIDPASITLARADGTGGHVVPFDGPPGPNVTIEDVGTPFDGELCDCHEVEGDGIDDLSIKFSRPEVVAALELATFEPGATVELVVSGQLQDGTAFSASDCILIVPQPDFDEDNDVDQSDFGHLQACYRGPMKSVDLTCRDADIDGDGDVDISDFGRLQRCISGAEKTVDPDCAD